MKPNNWPKLRAGMSRGWKFDLGTAFCEAQQMTAPKFRRRPTNDALATNNNPAT
jgi:hypothetical protein